MGKGKTTMPKRRPVERRRHLYLVFDDWSGGYSIRKIDLLGDHWRPPLVPVGTPEGPVFTGIFTLPVASLRFEATRGEPRCFAGAFGSKIMAFHPTKDSGFAPGASIYDVGTRCLSYGPKTWPDRVNPTYIPVGDRLFVLDAGSFEVLNPLPPYGDPNRESSASAWAWSKLPVPIFHCDHVTAYAMHPDGRTFFVSIGGDAAPATFSLDTVEPVAKEDWKWELRGKWKLPFTGRAYYVRDADTIGQQQCPAMKFSKEKLFSEVRGENHIGANLVYLGCERKFCLLECISIQADLPEKLTDSDETNGESGVEAVELPYVDDVCEDSSDDANEDSDDEVNKDRYRFFRLTAFSPQYDKNGDLTIGISGWYRYYNMPQEVSQSMFECPVAFWM
ncbi:unnamed protein product [Urochloa decumbens]|uniref:Uncharacterized protein n=1 Tax=Urochloa decumbens TaxID=240449 RepID=A0ABC8Y386_9POAL